MKKEFLMMWLLPKTSKATNLARDAVSFLKVTDSEIDSVKDSSYFLGKGHDAEVYLKDFNSWLDSLESEYASIRVEVDKEMTEREIIKFYSRLNSRLLLVPSSSMREDLWDGYIKDAPNKEKEKERRKIVNKLYRASSFSLKNSMKMELPVFKENDVQDFNFIVKLIQYYEKNESLSIKEEVLKVGREDGVMRKYISMIGHIMEGNDIYSYSSYLLMKDMKDEKIHIIQAVLRDFIGKSWHLQDEYYGFNTLYELREKMEIESHVKATDVISHEGEKGERKMISTYKPIK